MLVTVPLDSLPLLTFFDPPALLQAGGNVDVHFRYQKGIALLGYLSCQPGKVVRREALADLLWPDLDASSGRANLRVVLADIQSVLKSLNLPHILTAQRDWIQFNPDGIVNTDRWALQNWGVSAADAFAPAAQTIYRALWLQRRADGLWLRGAEDGVSPDFASWVHAQRGVFTQGSQPSLLFDESDGKNRRQALDLQLSVPVFPDLVPVALLRIELDPLVSPAGGRDDETLAHVERHCPMLDVEAAYLGGQRIKHDDVGCLYVFGLNSLHAGYRVDVIYFALRAARLLEGKVGVRIGLTCGPVLKQLAPESHIVGWRLRLVERLALTANAGQLVCDESCRDLALSMAFEPVGVRQFRGFASSIELFVLNLALAQGVQMPGLGDSHLPLVGRAPDLEILEQRLGSALVQGGVSVCLLGPSGVGKSRLALEFARRYANQGGRLVWFVGRPETQSEPWSVVRDALVRELGAGHESILHAESWLTTWRRQPGADAVDVVAQLVRLRQVSALARPALVDAIAWLLGEGSAVHTMPVLVVLEDLAWFDAPTLTLLAQVAGRVEGVRWLAVAQELNAIADAGATPCPVLAALPNLVHQSVGPLTDADCHQLLTAGGFYIAPDSQAEAAMRRQIQDSRGLPLYLLAQSEPSLPGGHFDAYCHALANRLGDARSVFDKAALLGLLFRVSDLDDLCGQGPTRSALAKGLAAQWVLGRGADHFAFFHPALLDYLIRSMPRDVLEAHATSAAQVFLRRGLFAKAAQLWERAHQPEQAMAAWRNAVHAALRVNDVYASCEHFSQIERLGYAGIDEPVGLGIEWRLQHAQALVASRGYGFARVHELAQEVAGLVHAVDTSGQLPFRVAALAYLGSSSQGRVDGLAYAQSLSDLALLPAHQVAAAWAQGNTLFWLGHFDSARDWFLRCVGLCASVPSAQRSKYFASDPAVFASVQLAWVMWLQGESATEVVRHQQQAADWLRDSSHRQDVCVYHSISAFLAWNQGDLKALAYHAAESLSVAEAESFALWRAIAGLQLALVQAHEGTVPDLSALTVQSAEVTESYQAGLTTALWMVADIYQACGQHAAALTVTEDILSNADDREHRHCLMDVWRIRSQALGGQGDAFGARAAMDVALTLAHNHGLHGWVSRWTPALA